MVELAVEAHVWRAATLRQLGREEEAALDTAIVRRWAEQSRRPFFLALASMLSIADHLRHGRVDAADAALADLPSGADTSPNFSAGFAAQLFLLRRQQGRSDEFVPLFDMLADDAARPAAWNAARVLTLAETGEPSASDALMAAVAQLVRGSRGLAVARHGRPPRRRLHPPGRTAARRPSSTVDCGPTATRP